MFINTFVVSEEIEIQIYSVENFSSATTKWLCTARKTVGLDDTWRGHKIGFTKAATRRSLRC